MNETAPRVIKIPAKPESVRQAELQRQLRVAAYCRVSTKEEDQANSYEVQKEYYTDKIMSNSAWTMAGIFADKGITGTSVKKREDFMRMIRHCRQRKIDVVLTKSVSRFARNTVDCLYYTRALKELGIAVIFEKENINSLEEDSELRITLSGAFAQSESESISANVTWGKRRAMESGKATIQYKYLYGYRRGADDKPEIIPEEAEVVRWIYERYLAGASTRMLRDELHEQGVIYSEKSPQWTLPHSHNTSHNSAKKAITFSSIFFGYSGAFLERSYCFQQRKICALCTREYRKDAAVSGVPGKRLTVILSRQAVPQHQETHWRRRQGQRRVSAPADCG